MYRSKGPGGRRRLSNFNEVTVWVAYVAPRFRCGAIGIGNHDLAFHRLEEATEHQTNSVNLVTRAFFLTRFAATADSPDGCNTKPSALSPAVSLRRAYGSLLPSGTVFDVRLPQDANDGRERFSGS